MCGSVKNSRAVKKSQVNFDNELTDEQRLSFAAKANLAQVRREQREAVNKKWAQKHAAKSPTHFSVLQWFKRYLAW